MNLYERPQFHFAPAQNWMNDPNGLLYYKGKYHLFFQHNPNGILWGDMSWGHAVSTDLFHWEHLPVALPFFPDAGIFSGSAVVDELNTSGFGDGINPPLVAIFTIHKNDGSNQSQSLAYSKDEGLTWTYYDNNPVLDLSMKDFRDPKVWRDEENNRWLMAVVKPQEFKACFYQSQNLIEWELLSEFGPAGSTAGCWECPDLFPLTTPDGITKWILIISINPGGPNGGSATQYFIGDFDGTTFVADDNETRWIDSGFDNYAGVTFNNTPDNRRIFIGWMSNWEYTNDWVKTGRLNQMTTPRELSLISRDGKFILQQQPVAEFEKIKVNRYLIDFSQDMPSTIEISDGEMKVLLTYSPQDSTLTFDRSKAWLDGSLRTTHSAITSHKLLLLIDGGDIELFDTEVSTVLTDLTLLANPTVKAIAPATLRKL